MKKLKKSVKIILIASVSLVCVAAIVLGCIFGFKKKPGEPGGGGDTPSNFTASQQALANEIKANSKVLDYKLLDNVPYGDFCSYDQITMFGDNYFAFETNDKRQEFYTYRVKEDGTIETNCLTDSTKNPFVKIDATSYKIGQIKENYVVIVSEYPNATNNSIINKFYSLVYFGDYENPVQVYSYDANTTEFWIPTGVELKENYFTLATVSNADIANGVGDLNIQYGLYTKSSEDNINLETLTAKYYYDSSKFEYKTYDSMFYVQSDNMLKIVYLKANNFEYIEKTIDKNEETKKLLWDYEIDNLSDTKFLITKTIPVSSDKNVKDTSVLIEQTSQGSVYVDYEYYIYDYSGDVATEKAFPMEKGYALLNVQQDVNNVLESFFGVTYQKLVDNQPQDDYLTVYFDKKLNKVVKFNSNVDESIISAGTKSFVTNFNIFESNGKTQIASNYSFEDKNNYQNQGLIGNGSTKYVLIMKNVDKNASYGLMDFDGNVILDPTVEKIKEIADVHDGYAVIKYIDDGNKYYKVNLQTKEKTQLNDYDTNSLLNIQSMGFVLNDSKLEDLSGTSLLPGVSEIVSNTKTVSIRGNFCVELKMNDNSKKIISLYSTNKDISNQVNTVFGVEAGSEGESNVLPQAYNAENYATSVSGTYYSASISQSENPTFYIYMSNSQRITSATFGLHFFNSYTLTISGTSSIPASRGTNVYSVSYSYGGDWHTTPYGWFDNTNKRMVYYARFSYTNWFGYGGVSIDSHSVSTATQYFWVDYYMLPAATVYSSSTSNIVKNYGYATSYATECGNSTLAFAGLYGSITYGHVDYWRGQTTSDGSGLTWYYTPSYFDDYNVCSARTSDYFGATFYPGNEYSTNVWWNMECILFAHFTVNHYYLDVNGSYTYYSVQANTNVYNYGADKTGYTWAGWKVTGADADETHYVYHVNSSGTVVATETFTGTSFTINKRSDATGVYLYGLEEADGEWCDMDSFYNPVVYTITIDKVNGTGGTDAIYLHYSVGMYLTYNSSTYALSNAMTSSANPISAISRHGYTFAGVRLTDNSPVFIQSNNYIISTYSKTLVSADTTVYAVWTANTYTVVYYTTDTATTSITASYDVAFNAPTPTKQFYYFTGWTISNAENSTDYPSYYGTSSSASTSFTGTSKTLGSSYLYFKNLRSTTDAAAGSAANNTVTLTPNWAGNKYYVDYDANNGVFTDSQMERFYNYENTADESLGQTGSGWLWNAGVEFFKYNSTPAYLVWVYVSDIDMTGPLLISTNLSAVYYNYKSGLWGSKTLVDDYYGTYTKGGVTYYISATTGWDEGNKLSYIGAHRITYTASSMSSAISYFFSYYPPMEYGRTGYHHYGTIYNTSVPTRTGYTFAGWTISGMDTATTHNFYNSSSTVVKTSTATSVTVDATVTKYANLRGSTGNVKFVARWTPNTYNITYVLTSSDGLAVGAWEGTETHPTKATYDQWFYLDNVFQSEKSWPLGYYFNGWTISGQNGTWYAGSSTSASARTTTSATNLSASTKYFKNLQSTNGATVTLTARWEPYSYDLIYQANGEYVTLNSSSATSVKFNSWGTVYNPSRIGFTFTGWEVSGLSDEISHQISYNAGSNVTTFDSVNGFYANPANPNKAILLYDTYGKNYFKLKNFHYVSGADVILKAIWTPNDYTVTYYYSNDSVWSTNPTLAQLNLSSNMTLSKTQTVTFSQYFTTFGVGNNETQANVVTVPTGYKLKGWLILTSTISNTTVTNLSSSYVVGANTEVLYNYTFATAHTTSGMTVGNLYAYAVYEAVVFTLVYYVPDNTTGVLGDLSTYKDVATATVAYGSSFTTPTVFGEYPVSSYMISSNLYNAGEIFNAVNGCSFAGVDYVFYAGLTVVWGLSNAKAKYPENPVFYAYMEYNEDYVGTLTKLSFEYTLAGYAVSAIDKTISGHVKIPKMYDDGVHGPMKVYAVDSYGFSGCTSMTSIDMGYIEYIYTSGLRGCTGLTSIDFPSTLSYIDDSSFYGCTGLTSLYIPATLKNISGATGSAFYGCTGLTSITVDSNHETMDSRNNCNAIIHKDCLGYVALIVGCSTTVIPSDIEYIRDYAFASQTAITSISIPASVQMIGMHAFYGCSKLSTVNFETGSVLKSVSHYSFRNCTALTGITLPETVTTISSYAFAGSGIKSFTIPSKVTTINRNTFDSCTSLKEVYVPAAVTTFEGSSLTYAPFRNCLSSLVIYCEADSKPDGFGTYWNYYASSKTLTVYWGSEMPTINKLTFTASGSSYTVTPSSSMTGKVVIPASYNGKTVTSISGFNGNTNITDLVIYGNGVTLASFANCTNLKTLNISGNVSFSSGYTFQNCTSLETVIIGDGVTTLKTYTFYNCTGLKTVYVSNTVTTMDSTYIFFGCASATLYMEHTAALSSWHSYWNVYEVNPSIVYLPTNWGQTIPTSI